MVMSHTCFLMHKYHGKQHLVTVQVLSDWPMVLGFDTII